MSSGTSTAGQPIDIAVVTALHEELDAVLGLLEDKAHWQAAHIDNFKHHIGRFNFAGRSLSVVACHLFEMGANATTAQVLRLKALQPKMVIMVGICAGWEEKGISLGDVVVATAAFDAGRGKWSDADFRPDPRTYAPPPWLIQHIKGFIAKDSWTATITAPRPLSLRYQAEWLLCRMADRRVIEPSADEWREIEQVSIDYARAKQALRAAGLIDAAATFTSAADAYLNAIREYAYGRLIARPDPPRPQAHDGVVASSSAVVAVPDPFSPLERRIRTVRAIDMEIAAFYSAVLQLDPHRVIPVFAVKGVSDFGTLTKDDTFHEYASEAAARWMYAFLAEEIAPHWDDLFPPSHDGGSPPRGPPPRRDLLPPGGAFPPHYIERSELLDEACATLLGANQTVLLTGKLAMHGMGGIGKSVLARALCEDEAVRAAFPDGILWAPLGQSPDLVGWLRRWVEHLGGTVREQAPTPEGLSGELGNLLRERRCLLVLDDLWRQRDADLFMAGALSCHVLITSRDAELAHSLGAQIQRVDLLDEAEAIVLLEQWAGGKLADVDAAQKQVIVQELGRLPLAIRLAGSQLRLLPPQKWLEDFRARRRALRERRPEGGLHDDLDAALTLSINALDATDRQRYLELAIFKEDEPIPLAAVARLWQGRAVDDDSASESHELLADLAARALLDYDETKKLATIHDLLRDLIGELLGSAGQHAAHQALLAAYRPPSGRWADAADDGYLYDHLAYHLEQAEQWDELRSLFVNDSWLQVRVAQSDWRYDGYLADMEIAWAHAEEVAQAQIDAGVDPAVLADCVRYALIRTTVNSLAASYEPALVAEAVATGLPGWSPQRALSIAQKIADPARRAAMGMALLRVQGTTEAIDAELGTVRTELQNFVLHAVQAISDEQNRSGALAALAPHLAGHPDLLDHALTAAQAISDEQNRSRALAALAPQLSPVQRADIHRQLHSDLLALLRKQPHEARSAVLGLCEDSALFAPPFVAPPTLAAIAQAIIEVCEEWRWL